MTEILTTDDFWEDCEYAREQYVDVPVTDALVESVERELGFKLPAAYVALMRTQNGGIPLRTCYPTKAATSWAEDHVAITGIMGIGREKMYSLLGRLGSPFMQKEWGYPTWGVCICDCPSAGHDMIMLDYRECGPEGEPKVVHVDQESGFRVTLLAPNFETFARGLVSEAEFDELDDYEAEYAAATNRVLNGKFSTRLSTALQASAPGSETTLRNLLRAVVDEKGHLALHGDALSYLVYDMIFDVYATSTGVATPEDFLGAYEDLIALGDGEISTGGYAPTFIKQWLEARMATEAIERNGAALTLSDAQRRRVTEQLERFR